MNFIIVSKNIIKRWYNVKEIPKHLGRWNLDYNNSLLKADYANLDCNIENGTLSKEYYNEVKKNN